MLKIKDNVDLRELEKFGFVKEMQKKETHKYVYEHGEEDYYTEILYKYDNGINTIEIVEKRQNSDWIHQNQEREIDVYESDYELRYFERYVVYIIRFNPSRTSRESRGQVV